MPLYLLNIVRSQWYDNGVPAGGGSSSSGSQWYDNGVPAGGGSSSSGANGISAMFSSLFDVLNIQFNYGGFTFSLYDVFKYQLILILVGICIVKIWFFATDYFSNPLNYRSN